VLELCQLPRVINVSITTVFECRGRARAILSGSGKLPHARIRTKRVFHSPLENLARSGVSESGRVVLSIEFEKKARHTQATGRTIIRSLVMQRVDVASIC